MFDLILAALIFAAGFIYGGPSGMNYEEQHILSSSHYCTSQTIAGKKVQRCFEIKELPLSEENQK